ncbi:hypothetical protein IHE55_27055 [Streptomyces pactum]|uniref:DNA-3-methyladenine glycosylase II n=1 Tax=Streptomyces pactum TaxID=68249 RepID=A0ABS0NSP5_9ACTN|nr:hypothetical protein [Streptomyces pactum]MBH5338247.1 hypothetical protein [Streptomyces pactum]
MGAARPAGWGGLTHLFPTAETLAEASLAPLGLPADRRQALRAVSTALADGTLRLDPGADREEAERRLLELPGVGAWAAGYIRMRALGDPDVLLPRDPVFRTVPPEAGWGPGGADGWRPWRSYAMHHLWHRRRSARPAPSAGPAGTAGRATAGRD